MRLRPAAGKCVIRQFMGPEQTEGGLFIPDTARDGQYVSPLDAENRGEVVAIGKTGWLYDNKGGLVEDELGENVPSYAEFEVGDTVRFVWNAGEVPSAYYDGSDKHYFVRFQDVVAIE